MITPEMWNSIVDERDSLKADNERQRRALNKLSQAVGNHALGWDADGSLEEALADFVVERLKERDRLQSWQVSIKSLLADCDRWLKQLLDKHEVVLTLRGAIAVDALRSKIAELMRDPAPLGGSES